MNLTTAKKNLIAFLTVVVTVAPWVLKALNVIPGTSGTAIATTISSVLGIAGIALHWLVPNTTTDPAVAATQSVKLVEHKPRARKRATRRTTA